MPDCVPALAKWRESIYNTSKTTAERLRDGGNDMALDMKYFEEMEAKIPKGKVRTRFAPSPTGYMHVGNLRTACTPGSSPGTPAAPSSFALRTPIRAAGGGRYRGHLPLSGGVRTDP